MRCCDFAQWTSNCTDLITQLTKNWIINEKSCNFSKINWNYMYILLQETAEVEEIDEEKWTKLKGRSICRILNANIATQMIIRSLLTEKIGELYMHFEFQLVSSPWTKLAERMVVRTFASKTLSGNSINNNYYCSH